MPLAPLPEVVFPVTRKQANALIESVVQLNLIYAGIDEKTQKAIGIVLKTLELWIDSKGKVDYTGPGGHDRLKQDAESLVGEGTGLSTRIGDMRAAGLAIDYHNVAVKFRKAGMPITDDVRELRRLAAQFAQLPGRKLDEVGLMLSYLRKDTAYIDNATRGEEGDF